MHLLMCNINSPSRTRNNKGEWSLARVVRDKRNVWQLSKLRALLSYLIVKHASLPAPIAIVTMSDLTKVCWVLSISLSQCSACQTVLGDYSKQFQDNSRSQVRVLVNIPNILFTLLIIYYQLNIITYKSVL
jgi:hypothetical protein